MFFAETLLPKDDRVRVVRDHAELPALAAMLRERGRHRQISWDTETSGFDWWNDARPVGHCFGYDVGDGRGPQGIYLPMRHLTVEKQLDERTVTAFAQDILGDAQVQAFTQFGKFDKHQAEADGIKVNATLHLVETMAHLIDEESPLDLETLAQIYRIDSNPFLYKNIVHDLFKEDCQRRGVRQKDSKGYAYLNSEVIGRYGATDGRLTLGLGQFFMPWIEKNYWEPYGIEMALMPIICKAERVGMRIDIGYLQELHEKCEKKSDALIEKVQRLAGYDVNPASDEEVRNLIYHRLGNEVRFTTETRSWVNGIEVRNPACDAVALRDIIHRTGSEVCRALLEYRDNEKILTTYTTPIIDKCDARGYLHGRLESAGTVTWRFASKEPNLQNFPSEDKDGIRKAFLVDDGIVRIFLDFSQVELRVLAFLSMEPTLFQAFLEGRDVHSETAIRMFGKATKDNRRPAKEINFGVAFGLTKYGLRDSLNKKADPEKGIPTVDDNEAGAFLDQWHRLFPRVGTWIEDLCSEMVRQPMPQFTNHFGYTRRIPTLRAFGADGRRAKRMAVASKVQGTAAGMTKIKLIAIDQLCKWGREHGVFEATIVTTIHDEIQVDVNRDGAYEFARRAKPMMEHFPQFAPMPIIADAEWSATTWADKVPVFAKKAA